MQGFTVIFEMSSNFSVLCIGFHMGCGESIAILFDRMVAARIWG
jgi:hypothetical protein